MDFSSPWTTLTKSTVLRITIGIYELCSDWVIKSTLTKKDMIGKAPTVDLGS